jgi:ABC-type nitrate/sulfonate/bicarbonate transport system ATPase subunit
MDVKELLDVDEVTYAWRNEGAERPVLDRVTFSLRASEVLAITGPSGCGKTTLLRILAGLLQPSSGTVHRFPSENQGPSVGFMFQDYKLVPWLSVRENLTFGQTTDHCDGSQFGEIIELMGLQDHLLEYPARLSGGLKERASLGRALLGKPILLMLDEPLGSTDYVHRLQIEDYLFDRVTSERIGALVVTHDLDQAVAIAHRVLILPPAGSSRTPIVLDVPEELRQHCPSEARLSPQMLPVMRELIATYEALL